MPITTMKHINMLKQREEKVGKSVRANLDTLEQSSVNKDLNIIYIYIYIY